MTRIPAVARIVTINQNAESIVLKGFEGYLEFLATEHPPTRATLGQAKNTVLSLTSSPPIRSTFC